MRCSGGLLLSMQSCKRRLKSAARVTWVTRRFKMWASSLTMKHVPQYGRLDRDSQKSVGGGCEQTTDSSRDKAALADVEEDSGTQSAAGLPATEAATEEKA